MKKTKGKKPAEINVEASEAIAALLAGQPGVLENLYDRFRKEFLSWAAKRFYSNTGDFEDAWQEAVLVFYERVKSRRLTELRCKVKTFLFAVGYKWLQKNERKLKRIWWTDEVDKVMTTDPMLTAFVFDGDIWEEERILLRAAMKALSPKCQEMLTQRHYNERTILELMAQYDMDANNVSSNLSQCLAKLKEIIKKMSKK